MRRKSTKQSPAASANERKFIGLVKELPCVACGTDGPSIYDHIYGSSKKLYNGLERVYVGHYAGIPLCLACDSVKTRGSRRAFINQFGEPEYLWLKMIEDECLPVPQNVKAAIQEELSELTPTQTDTALQFMTTVGCKSF